MMILDTQQRIAEIARLGRIQDQVLTEFDWVAIEESLGLMLPADYKLMADSLPAGQFAGKLILIRPGDLQSPPDDYLGFYRGRLDNMRTWREAGHGEFPYPIYPEVGGVLPWGRGPENDTYFWVTSTEDPNAWPIVHADPDFIRWTMMSGTASDVVISMMEETGPQVPTFRLLPELAALSNAPLRSVQSAPLRSVQSAPLRSVQPLVQESIIPDVVDGSAQLRAMLRVSHPETKVQQTDWSAAEKALGLPLPSDYKWFIDSFGSGTLGDITVVAPYGPPGFDLFALQEKKREEAALLPPHTLPPTFHPDLAGLIVWGETADGWSCAWAPVTADPNQWPIAYMYPMPEIGAITYSDGDSFSSFLARYANGGHAIIGRAPWTGGPVFTPGG